MSEEQQDNKNSVDSSDDAVMEQVTEERAVKKQGGYLGSLLLLIVLAGTGVAAWYYQAMWLHQAQQWWSVVMPKQASVSVDPMAAPAVANSAVAEQAQSGNDSSGYAVLPATPMKEHTEEISKEAVTETSDALSTAVTPDPVAEPAAVAQVDEVSVPPAAPALNEAVKDIANDIVLDDVHAAAKAPATDVNVTPMSTVAAASSADNVSHDSGEMVSLAQARQAFWTHDLATSEMIYKELIKHDPAAADAWGELGNLYYGQAKWPQAANAYAEAAIQLLERGEYPQAMFLHYMVRGLDPLQAARIDAKLHAMQAAPHS